VVVPRKTGKLRVTKESSRDGIACSLTHFSVFSQVSNLGCIEFLNRESQVRFLPGALSQSPRSRALFGVFEQRLRVRLQGSGPALAPRRTELRPRCDLNGRPRPRLGQLPRGDACQGDLPSRQSMSVLQ
jgi:hypothetical protein